MSILLENLDDEIIFSQEDVGCHIMAETGVRKLSQVPTRIHHPSPAAVAGPLLSGKQLDHSVAHS